MDSVYPIAICTVIVCLVIVLALVTAKKILGGSSVARVEVRLMGLIRRLSWCVLGIGVVGLVTLAFTWNWYEQNGPPVPQSPLAPSIRCARGEINNLEKEVVFLIRNNGALSLPVLFRIPHTSDNQDFWDSHSGMDGHALRVSFHGNPSGNSGGDDNVVVSCESTPLQRVNVQSGAVNDQCQTIVTFPSNSISNGFYAGQFEIHAPGWYFAGSKKPAVFFSNAKLFVVENLAEQNSILAAHRATCLAFEQATQQFRSDHPTFAILFWFSVASPLIVILAVVFLFLTSKG